MHVRTCALVLRILVHEAHQGETMRGRGDWTQVIYVCVMLAALALHC